jgi:hypothetical protein
MPEILPLPGRARVPGGPLWMPVTALSKAKPGTARADP